jgi:DHA3 family macrolide efflux protein-like MFS transporter
MVALNVLSRYPGFGWLWLGQLLSQIGNAVFLVVALWEIQLRSPFLLSIAGLATTVPTLLGAFGGVIVDSRHPGRLMLWTDILRTVAVVGGLACLVVPGTFSIVAIVLLGVDSLGNVLFGPAEAVVIPRLVADRDLPAANGVYSLTYQIANALGSAVGGASLAAVGLAVVFGFDAGSFALSALAILLMLRTLPRDPRTTLPGPLAPGPPVARQPAVWQQMRSGWGGLRALPVVLPLLPVIVFTNFAFMAAFTMLPYWSRHVLHADAAWYGLVAAAWAAGTIGGSLAAVYAGRWPLRVASSALFAAQAVATGSFALVRAAPAAAGVLLAAGLANGAANALLITLIQRLVPDALRGRVFGLLMTVLGVANPLGTLMAGLLLHVLPLWWSWALSAGAGLALAGGLYLKVPADLSVRRPEAVDVRP